MEEDDPTPRALPRWVQLEYTVSTTSPSLRPLHASLFLAFGANELGWTCNLAPHSLTDEPGLYPRTHTTTYKHMRTLAGPDASIAFTHLSRSASASLSAALNTPAPSSSSSSSPDPASPPPAHAECHEQGVLSLMQARNIPLEHVCLLDPKAPTALTPADGDAASKFAWFLFGVRILRSPFLPKPFRPLTTPSILLDVLVGCFFCFL